MLKEGLRGCANRSWAPGGACVPAVAGPSFADDASDVDDRVGEGDERIDDPDVFLGADSQFLESAVVPGVRSLDDPSRASLDACGDAFGGDSLVAAEFGQ